MTARSRGLALDARGAAGDGVVGGLGPVVGAGDHPHAVGPERVDLAHLRPDRYGRSILDEGSVSNVAWIGAGERKPNGFAVDFQFVKP